MKIAALTARLLLGLIFVVFGLNGFLHFIPGPLPPGLAGQFVNAMMQSHYDLFVSAAQVVGGALLFVPRFAPLGLVILGPVLANILAFHIFLLPGQSAVAIVAALLWCVAALRHLSYFRYLVLCGPATAAR